MGGYREGGGATRRSRVKVQGGKAESGKWRGRKGCASNTFGPRKKGSVRMKERVKRGRGFCGKNNNPLYV